MTANQMFLVDDFIKKYATKNVWNVSDQLFKMVQEVISENQAEKKDSLLPAEQCVD
jgi:hypothetical protein